MNWRSRASLIGLITLASTNCFAWIDTGHMIVADIARAKLKPEVLSQVDELLKIGGDARSQDMLGAAAWADDIKRERPNTGPWHYVDQHFRSDNKPDTNGPDEENVIWALNKFEPILADKSKPAAERAEALRFILHFVGDIHQPLHCVAHDSDEEPKGDKGGNDFKIKGPSSMSDMARPISNLHALWDFGCGLYRGTERPLAENGKTKIDSLAETLAKKYPESKMREAKNLDANAWAVEGLKSAKKDVYAGLTPNTEPSEKYMAHGQDVCGRRIALAGYRLARLLNKLLGS